MPISRTSAAALVPAFSLALALSTSLAVPAALRAQARGADAFVAGRVTERIPSREAPGRTFALYLPSVYSAEKTWPVLFLMDPRGRALVPLELFREAAERHGWVLMSSYHTLSDADSATAVNDASLNAMLGDAQERLSIDTRRIYLAGFSGTARHAWGASLQLDGNLAGIIGVGAGFPSPPLTWRSALPQVKPFAYFGTSGELDFNFEEMLAVDSLVAGVPMPHRTVFYPGPHAWPPREVATEALEWMQLQAMKSGLAPRDEAWIEAEFAERMEKARALEAAGAGLDALAEYRSAADDFAGVRDVAQAEARRDALGRDRAVLREAARREALTARMREYNRRLHAFLDAEVNAGDRLPTPERGLQALDIARLRREAADSGDAYASKAAQRMVALAMVWTAGYGVRQHFERRDFRRAAAVLRIAERIRPRDAGVCYSLARALAQTGETGPALDALDCAVASGRVPAAALAGDPLMEPLRADPRYAGIAARATAGS